VIPRDISSTFSQTLKTRGDRYVADRRVHIEAATADRILAQVQGSRIYNVTLTTTGGSIAMTCTCPYSADHGACKHQWAVLRQADDEGLLSNPEGLPEWKRQLEITRRQLATTPTTAHGVWPDDRRLVYVVDLAASRESVGLVVDLAIETRQQDGKWSTPTAFRLGDDTWLASPDPDDRRIVQMLVGASPADAAARGTRYLLRDTAIDTALHAMCDTGRCRIHAPDDIFVPVGWAGDEPWTLHLRIARDGNGYALTGVVRRGREEMSLDEPVMLHAAGVLLARGAFAPFEHGGAFAFVVLLRRHQNSLTLAQSELPELLDTLYSLPHLPALELPPAASVAQSDAAPDSCLSIVADTASWRTQTNVLSLSFRYGRVQIAADDDAETVFDRETLTLYHRDRAAELAARDRVRVLGAKEEFDPVIRGTRLVVSKTRLLPLVTALIREGWIVDAEGAVYRTAGDRHAVVRSGIDWFELDAAVRYGDEDVPLSTLVDALARGESTVKLRDGSIGLLDADWISRLRTLVVTGKHEGKHGPTRFAHSQVALLDALLATLPDATVDETFATARAELRKFDRIAPADPPATFNGTLRDYQREGLGWLLFLRQFKLGGCLADDMGLGKTVQVLALLDALRVKKAGPSIVVVPRSLVFNWMREAERFAPRLRLLDWSGPGRHSDAEELTKADLVITTYGLLRRDAPALSAVEFEYAILDEAQAIKNPATAAAKAARLLKARNRLALSGTPIENRLAELWSLFEFLNPGMLGSASAFGAMARAVTTGTGPIAPSGGDPAGRDLLARALRPVIMRRTKDQVAPELPPRIEQTLEVELEPPQRKFYDALLAESRRSVLAQVDRVGLGRSRMHVLEALLRLRQAACAPVLADPRKANLPSAKLDALIPALTEVVEENHKAIVFSQFTSFLALVRDRLDAAGLPYEYLDGKTRDRESRVDRFQNDPNIRLFLVSLKAGGHGLNLTAAEYVYLLDPWWNPAVEAQAIDRAHRIGQTRHVIATRLVARGTIEAKILALQESKRALADAILTADQGVLSKIGREELEALLAS
jgi:superfamily II DNA or RNA helicase